MFTLFHALILGVVEGVTEFLPISSTAHLILTAKILGLEQTDFLKSFEIIIQLGAILAVVVLYAKNIIYNKELFWRVVVAFLPAAIIGGIFYKFLKDYLFGNSDVVGWALGIGGVGLILFELLHKEKKINEAAPELITNKHAFIIGLAQSLAIVIPGVSRAAATIIAGSSLGYSRKKVVEFSFLLAIPTMCAASGLDMVKNYQLLLSGNLWLLVVGFLMSFAVALVAIKVLLKFIQKHSFMVFGIYRVVVAIFYFLVLR
jgi:undecaprenyl-diphosphatase